MKKYFFILYTLLAMAYSPIYGQGWVNKALKKVDDGLKGNTVNRTATPDYAGTTVKCTNKSLDIQFESCIRDGELTVLSYYVTNKDNDLKLNYIGRVNMIDCIETTSISTHGGDHGERVVEGNTVIATFSFYDEDGETTTIHVYDITPKIEIC